MWNARRRCFSQRFVAEIANKSINTLVAKSFGRFVHLCRYKSPVTTPLAVEGQASCVPRDWMDTLVTHIPFVPSFFSIALRFFQTNVLHYRRRKQRKRSRNSQFLTVSSKLERISFRIGALSKTNSAVIKSLVFFIKIGWLESREIDLPRNVLLSCSH